MAIGASFLDAAIGTVTGLVAGLFGKSKTRKTLDALKGQTDYLQSVSKEQSKTIKTAVIIFAIAAFMVVFFFIYKKGKP